MDDNVFGMPVQAVFSDFKLFKLHTRSRTDSQPARCMWNSCSYYKADDIHAHLLEFQSVHTDRTAPINIRYCFQCSEWLHSKCEWTDHVRLHSKDVTQPYGPIFVNGLMTILGALRTASRQDCTMNLNRNPISIM